MDTSPTLQSTPPIATSGADQQRRTWQARFSGEHSAFAWAVTAIAGAVSISFAPPTHSVIRLFLPIFVMAAYLLVTYPKGTSATGWRASRIAQLADSVYFLGFLWTLWALIDSFVLKSSTSAEAAFRIFGYALVTTAAGMGARLYLLNFKYRSADQVEEAQVSVEENLQKFSQAAQGACGTISDFRQHAIALNLAVEHLTGTVSKLERHFADVHQQTITSVTETIQKTVEEIRVALKGPVQEYGRAVRGFTSNVDQQSEALTAAVNESTSKIKVSVSGAGDTVQELIKKTGEQIAADNAALTAKSSSEFTRIIEQLQKLADQISSIKSPAEILESIGRALSAFEQHLANLCTTLAPASPLVRNIDFTAREVEICSRRAITAVDSLATRLGNIEVPDQVRIDVSSLTRVIDQLRTAVAALLDRAGDPRWHDTPRAASESLLLLTQSVNRLRDAVQTTENSVRKIPNPRGEDGSQPTRSGHRSWWPPWSRRV